MTPRILALVLVAGTIPLVDRLLPAPSSEEWVRRGNAAFEREAYAEAAGFYEKAERATTDPGLVAHNRATALYRLGRHRDAELLYRCCLEDATGRRRACALYGLGNALLQQSPERGASVLRDAVAAYERCLRHRDTDADLAADARHNLELAKLLLAKVPPKSGDQNDKPPSDNEDPPKPEPPKEDPRPPEVGMGKPDKGAGKKPVKVGPGQEPTPADEAGAGGSSGPPPVPNHGELVPMSREDAERQLADAAERILLARRKHQKELAEKFNGYRKRNW